MVSPETAPTATPTPVQNALTIQHAGRAPRRDAVPVPTGGEAGAPRGSGSWGNLQFGRPTRVARRARIAELRGSEGSEWSRKAFAESRGIVEAKIRGRLRHPPSSRSLPLSTRTCGWSRLSPSTCATSCSMRQVLSPTAVTDVGIKPELKRLQIAHVRKRRELRVLTSHRCHGCQFLNVFDLVGLDEGHHEG